MRYCGRPSSRGSQPMPAFWVSPKMSPLGRSRSISAVRGRRPRGPGDALFTSKRSLVDSTMSVKPRARDLVLMRQARRRRVPCRLLHCQYWPSLRSSECVDSIQARTSHGGLRHCPRGARVAYHRPPLMSRLFRFAPDVTAGSISALVTLSYSISYAVLIFSGPTLEPFLARGFHVALVVALKSSFPAAIAGPDSNASAILAVMAAGLTRALAGTPGERVASSVVLMLILT